MTNRKSKAGQQSTTAEGRASDEGNPDSKMAGPKRTSSSGRKARVAGATAGGDRTSTRSKGILSIEELNDFEQEYADGISAVQIVEVFVSRGARFSEATFRKYVQQGLLPRSRRVGRKGKNRGSLGVYPPKVIRRINVIKTLMRDGYTIEEIQSQFLQFADVVERLEECVTEALGLFRRDSESERFDATARQSLSREIADAAQSADELLTRINSLSKRLTESHEDSYRNAGAAGSAEDLL